MREKAILKIIISSILFTIFFAFFSCNGQNYTEFKVYPLLNEIELPAGGSGFITLEVEMPAKSYIYGNPKGPGTGRATMARVVNSKNFTFKSARFLSPKKYTPEGEKEFVWIYEKETKIFIPLKVKEKTKPGEYKITILFETLLCDKSSCTPLNQSINYTIKVITHGAKQSKIDSGLFAEFMISSSPEEYKKSKTMPYKPGKPKKIPSIENEIEKFQPMYISTIDISNIVQAILYGLLAGFILNFMPCVLPVVSLKIMSFIKFAGEDRRKLFRLGILFTLGILTSFIALAFLASFLGYNWGELFKKELFLITMIAVVFALTLSMFEVFTINVPTFAGKAIQNVSNQYADAFIKGLLATLLATPCSGPFLGGTLAWTLTQQPYIIFIIFISIGLGMSLPYILLTTNPRFIRLIPKPGDWMITFERIMAFFLMAATLYLIGILEQEIVMPTLWFLLFLGAALWQYGRFGEMNQPKIKRIISSIMAVLIIISGYLLSFKFFYNENKQTIISDTQNFSIKKLYENRNKGRISIVKFTADWCPNCTLVENMSLYTTRVNEAIINNNIGLLTADLTRDNNTAEQLLSQLGSHSIPFLAVFPAGQSFLKPICLRDIYSEDDIIEAIRIAKQKI